MWKARSWPAEVWRVRVFLIFTLLISLSACSAHKQDPQPEIGLDTSDPFNDPFFTQPPEWNNSVLQQSEVLAENDEEKKKPQTFLERTEGVVFSTLVVGASLGKLALPFLGLGF
jgi:hypothetical protein